MLSVCGVIIIALVFEYINGFHDTANAIATTVSTKVLTPRQAIALSTFFNLIGALVGVSVATTIGQGLVDTSYVTQGTILCALLGAIIWNIFTWLLALPSSSSHALIGGLCGATLANAKGSWLVINWTHGLLPKVILPMFVSPIVGIIAGYFTMSVLLILLRNLTPLTVNRVFGKLQIASAAFMGFSHGTNDAQKTMGIIALLLFTATQNMVFEKLPAWLYFLNTPVFEIAIWVKIVCALTMAAGTALGGWRIIRTMGHKLVRIQPIHGFAAESTSAAIIQVASHWGIPLSTTHVIASSIMGVGATKRLSAVRWGIVSKILWAWVFTLPITALIAFILEKIATWF